jgi:hypothetical protein
MGVMASILLLLLAATRLYDAKRLIHQLRVHVVPHSHVDPMWIYTPETYEEITSTILKGVLEQLFSDNQRSFVWESPYFLNKFVKKMGSELFCPPLSSPLKGACITYRSLLSRLLREGRFQLVGGGWVSHDESLTGAIQAIHNIADGREWIRNELGSEHLPSVAWFIDSFGHAASTSSILLGFNYTAEVLNRVHYSLKQRIRDYGPPLFIHSTAAHNERSRHFNWASCDSGLLSTILPLHYSSPAAVKRSFALDPADIETAAFEIYRAAVDSAGLNYHFDDVQKAAFQISKEKLLLIGDDFSFIDSERDFNILDSILSRVREISKTELKECTGSGPRLRASLRGHTELESGYMGMSSACVDVSAIYSTPLSYFDIERRANVEPAAQSGMKPSYCRPRLAGDLLPYSDNFVTDWTGFYSSRPVVKRVIT